MKKGFLISQNINQFMLEFRYYNDETEEESFYFVKPANNENYD